MTLRRTSTSLAGLIRAPLAGSNKGALCVLCGRIVNEEVHSGGEPGKTTWARFRVSHHGLDEERTFDMESVEWDHQDLAAMVQKTNWFAPGEGDLGLGIVAPNAGDHDDKDEFQPYVFGAGSK